MCYRCQAGWTHLKDAWLRGQARVRTPWLVERCHYKNPKSCEEAVTLSIIEKLLFNTETLTDLYIYLHTMIYYHDTQFGIVY